METDTFLIPVTEGCTHNSCSFCNMCQGVPFRMLSLAEIEEFLQEVRHSYGGSCDRIHRPIWPALTPSRCRRSGCWSASI